jgi:hypothetical protein
MGWVLFSWMLMMLDDSVRMLIQKARIVGFEGWDAQFSAATIAQFQAADDAGRFLSDEDMAEIVRLEGELEGLTLARLLRDEASLAVDEARADVLAAFPDITLPGGGLFPQERAIACWRDFWHFLRCVSYGVAADRSDFMSPVGLDFMRQLYEVLQVPLDAMVLGVDGLKGAALRRVPIDAQEIVALCFDGLRAQLKAFRD